MQGGGVSQLDCLPLSREIALRETTMNPEKTLIDAFYRKLGGRSVSVDVIAPDGSIVIPAGRRANRKLLATAVERGGAAALLDLFLINPFCLGTYGNQKVRKELEAIARSAGMTRIELQSKLVQILGPDGP
jgi:hypothetical protein